MRKPVSAHVIVSCQFSTKFELSVILRVVDQNAEQWSRAFSFLIELFAKPLLFIWLSVDLFFH